MKIKKVLKIVLLSILVFLIGFFHVSRKENLDIDEIYTYGLSNSSFQLDVEDFKEYRGIDLLRNYAMVKEGEEFNIKNVFFNQEMDTHPPLYYLIVNAICSINKNTFSMWYGLIINVILLIILFWEMRYLFSLIIKDNLFSTILTLISYFLYGFTNEIVFTRMYVMLTVISMRFVILILKYIGYNDVYEKNINESDIIKEKNIKNNDVLNSNYLSNNKEKINVGFAIKFYLICIFGLLTQYHFMIIAGFFSLILAIYLIKNKNIKMLIVTFAIGILSIITSYLIFPGMLNHFFGGASLHAITNDQSISFLQKFCEMALTLKEGFFGNVGIIIYVIAIILCIIINFVQRANNKSENFKSSASKKIIFGDILNNDSKKYYIYFLFCCIFYFIVIVMTVQFTFIRYLYNIYPLILILLLSPVYLVLKKFNKVFPFVSVILLVVLCITSNIKSQADSLNLGDEMFHQYLLQNKDVKAIMLYHSVDKNGIENSMGGTSKWKLPYPLYLMRDMENVTFVDTGYIKKLTNSTSPSICGYDDIFLFIYTTQDDNALINEIALKNNVQQVEKIYFTNYIHVYRLH